jgi:hypothetical protein
MKFRDVVIFNGKTFTVPQGIQRIDTRATHGWQVRYAGTKLFSDHSNDGSGAKASLEKATQELARRIAKMPAPSLLQKRPSESKTSDLPVGTFATLAPHGQYKAILDWRYLYNLAPGSYKLSVIYRVEPDKEPHAAGLYAGELRAHHAFVGRVQSSSVEIECQVR